LGPDILVKIAILEKGGYMFLPLRLYPTGDPFGDPNPK
jgi:hypothetical protein